MMKMIMPVEGYSMFTLTINHCTNAQMTTMTSHDRLAHVTSSNYHAPDDVTGDTHVYVYMRSHHVLAYVTYITWFSDADDVIVTRDILDDLLLSGHVCGML